MYNQSYEEYMRNVLGYTMENPNMYGMQDECNYMNESNYINPEIEELYPEIYKIIYPMVQKICIQNIGPITEETIEKMTNEIYINIESETNVNTQIQNIQNPRGDVKNPRAKEVEEPRQRNYLLRDLIRILLLRELNGNRPPMHPPMRPPVRPPRPMPPYNPNWR